ncbi:MAG: ABC transporter substrate-binding protein [Actinomycetota bacterium]
MKRRSLGGFLAILLALASCQSDEGGPSTTATTSPSTTAATTTTGTAAATTTTATTRPAGPNEVVIGSDQEPPTLNPYASGGDTWIVLEIAQAIHAGLTETDGATMELVPDLAVEVPSVANGGVAVGDDGTTTVTFRIRDEAVWEDGTPIVGEDVVFTYEVIAAIEDRPSLTEPYEAITGIAAHGKTVTLTFDQPTLAFETMFPTVIPAQQVRGSDVMADWNEVPWMSAGPFRFESWQRGDSVTLTQNGAYWRTDADGEMLPYLERVVFQFIPETDRLIDAFADREIDVFSPPPWSVTVDRLRALDGAEVTVLESSIWEHWSFQFGERNRNEDSLNEHLDFRRAVAHALDRQAVAALGYWEATRPLDAILGLHGLPTDRPWSQYDHDPQRAGELISGLCDQLGRDCEADPPVVVFSTTSNAKERPEIARLAVDMLAEAGIDVRLELEDSSLFFGPTLDSGTWDLGQWAWVARPDAAGALTTLAVYDPDAPLEGDPNEGWQSWTGSNYARWGTPAVSGWPTAEEWGGVIDFNQGPSTVRDEHTARYAEILDQMAATADRDEFTALAAEAERILADQVVVIPLIARNTVGAVWVDQIAGYVHSPWLTTWNIETWRRVDR